jgi:hypothetical protein
VSVKLAQVSDVCCAEANVRIWFDGFPIEYANKHGRDSAIERHGIEILKEASPEQELIGSIYGVGYKLEV